MSFKELSIMSDKKGTVLFYPYIPKKSLKILEKTLSTRWIGQGPMVDKFEKKFSNTKIKKDNLKFFISDMRNFVSDSKYGYIFNLFTSFGYFKKNEDNINVLKSCYNHLNRDGLIFIDFLNSEKIKMTVNILKETKNISGIKFSISKQIIDNYVVKNIKVKDKGNTYDFQEKVQLLNIKDFKKMFEISGFEIISTYGNYQMKPYDLDSSRLILCAKKVS